MPVVWFLVLQYLTFARSSNTLWKRVWLLRQRGEMSVFWVLVLQYLTIARRQQYLYGQVSGCSGEMNLILVLHNLTIVVL